MFLKRVLIAILICSQASYAGVAELVTNIGASAEYIAVGGNDSVSYGAHSVFNNPTQIADNDSFSVSLFTTTIMQDVNYRNAAISKQWGRFSAGVGYMDATVEDIPETLEIEDDEIGISSYYSAQAKAIKGAFSYKASEQFSIGMLINHYHNQVHNVIGSATNTDIGFSYKQYNLLFTGTIKNIYQNKN